jgi:hypothetical protein
LSGSSCFHHCLMVPIRKMCLIHCNHPTYSLSSSTYFLVETSTSANWYQDYFDAVALFINRLFNTVALLTSKLFNTGLSFTNRLFNTVLSLSSRFLTASPLVSSEGSNFAETKYIKCPFSCTQGPVTIEFSLSKESSRLDSMQEIPTLLVFA